VCNYRYVIGQHVSEHWHLRARPEKLHKYLVNIVIEYRPEGFGRVLEIAFRAASEGDIEGDRHSSSCF
jgi:hypothetical protein